MSIQIHPLSALSEAPRRYRAGGAMQALPQAGLLLALCQVVACGHQMVGWPITDTGETGDVMAPMVITTTPLHDAIDVATSPAIIATFNESMDAQSLDASAFTLRDGSGSVAGVVTPFGDAAVRFTPAEALERETEFTATVTTDAADIAGNTLAADYVWTFTTIPAGGDVTAPRVIATDPGDFASNVSLDVVVRATFNEAMNSHTITSSTFEALAPDATVVPGTVAYDAAAQTAVFTPDDDLLVSSTYLFTVTTGAADSAGNALAADYVWSFTTRDPGGDVTPPRVIYTDPIDLAVDVPLDLAVHATFSEDMDPLTISGATFEAVAPDSSVVAGSVSYSVAGQTASFTPDSPFAPETTYVVTVDTGATDLAGNALVADAVWSFTTEALGGDVIPPRVIYTDPIDLAEAVPLELTVHATFSKDMDPLTLNGATFEVVAPDASVVAGVVSYTVAGQTASFIPDTLFAPETTYVVTVNTGATDLAGIALAVDAVWSFTTEALDAAPTVILTVPVDLALDVAVDSTVIAAFSEPMDPLTIQDATFDLTAPDMSEVTGVVSYDVVAQTLVFTPDSALAADTVYTATVTTGATDLAGLAMASDVVWTFSTGEAPWTLLPVELGSLRTFVAVAGGGLTNSNSSGTTTLGGDVGLSPTGTCLGDGVPCTATNPVVTGTMYVADAVADLAKVDLTAAYVDAMSRPIGTSVSDLSGMTLAPGVYTSGSAMSVAVGGTVTLDGQGDANAVWIFQVGSSLTVNNDAQILLINGAQAKNVYWAVFASSTLGSNVRFQGSVLAGASNSVGTDSIVVGRLLCTTGQITLLSNAITLPPS